MTDEEKTDIVNQIIQALKGNSKTIGALLEATKENVNVDDFIELSSGLKVRISTIVDILDKFSEMSTPNSFTLSFRNKTITIPTHGVGSENEANDCAGLISNQGWLGLWKHITDLEKFPPKYFGSYITEDIDISSSMTQKSGTVCYCEKKNIFCLQVAMPGGGFVYYSKSNNSNLVGTTPIEGCAYIRDREVYIGISGGLLLLGIAQTTGDSKRIPMSQDAVTRELLPLQKSDRKYNKLTPYELYEVGAIDQSLISESINSYMGIAFDLTSGEFLFATRRTPTSMVLYGRKTTAPVGEEVPQGKPQQGRIYTCGNRTFVGIIGGLHEIIDYEITTITV